MIVGGWTRFSGRRVLLLQGPIGPFFRRMADALHRAGAASVDKVNFNGGDSLFYPFDAIGYRGTMQDWPQALARLVTGRRIDTIFLFGDCRAIHQCVRAVAEAHGVEVWVFEEGYVRPDFVTLEQSGVNNHSAIPRDPAFYRQLPDMALPVERPVGNTFSAAACWTFLYYVAAILTKPYYRHYRHHRPLSIGEARPWLLSPLRKYYYRFKERRYMAFLCGDASRRFFLVPLQVGIDAQVHVHSDFESVAQFIEYVVTSFALHAAADQQLVIKHHPMDRGYHDYTALLARLARRYRLQGRLLYLHDQHLPTLLSHATGVVVINSTVGLSAMNHALPLVVLGDAAYALPGLSYQHGLDTFWQAAASFQPDLDLYRRFRGYLIRNTQLNGNFSRHGIFDWAGLPSRPERAARRLWRRAAQVSRPVTPADSPTAPFSTSEID